MKKKININDLIFEKIKFRYELFDLRSVRLRAVNQKLLLDSFYSHMICKEIATPSNDGLFGKGQYEQNGYCISPRIASDINGRTLHISELVSMLGYTKTDISKLFQSVKTKGLDIVLIGLGGTGSNFLHWMYEMAEWTGKENIFYSIRAYDNDNYDIPNMLRVPFEPSFNTKDFSAKKAKTIPKKFELLASINTYKPENLTETITNKRSFTGSLPLTNTIIYGAPDIESRAWLKECPYTFIAATHRDSEFSLVENPAVDNDLMMETYGKINLSKFFLNHLTMTIKFLESIRDRETSYGGTDEETIIRANFDEMYAEQLNSGFKAGAKKLYVASRHIANVLEDMELPEERRIR